MRSGVRPSNFRIHILQFLLQDSTLDWETLPSSGDEEGGGGGQGGEVKRSLLSHGGVYKPIDTADAAADAFGSVSFETGGPDTTDGLFKRRSFRGAVSRWLGSGSQGDGIIDESSSEELDDELMTDAELMGDARPDSEISPGNQVRFMRHVLLLCHGQYVVLVVWVKYN